MRPHAIPAHRHTPSSSRVGRRVLRCAGPATRPMHALVTTALLVAPALVLGFGSLPHASPAECAGQVVATADACTTLQPAPAGYYACSTDCSLDVAYSGTTIGCGSVLSLDQAAIAPRVTYVSAEAGELYSLMVLNTDDSIPIAPILHYFQADVRGEDLQSGVEAILEGEESALKGYHGPNPCWATPCAAAYSTFTYVWLVLKQTGTVGSASIGSTQSFDLEAAMATYGLSAPLASSYFVSGACACPSGDEQEGCLATLAALAEGADDPEPSPAPNDCAEGDYVCLYGR